MKMFVPSHVSLVLLQTGVVLAQGLPQNATEDTVLNYFENSGRSGVEEVKIKGTKARVMFVSSEGNFITCVAGVWHFSPREV